MASLDALSSASIVFMVLYLVPLAVLLRRFFHGSAQLWSRWLLVLLHIVVRLASNVVGIVYGTQHNDKARLLTSYIDLGIEAYFLSVVYYMRFLIAWHEQWLESGSWLEPRRTTPKTWRTFVREYTIVGAIKHCRTRPSVLLQWLLILGNVCSLLGTNFYAAESRVASMVWMKGGDVVLFKALRGAGQATVTLVACIVFACVIRTAMQSRGAGTLTPHLLVMLFFAVRGTFGILDAVDTNFGFFHSVAQTGTMRTSFVVIQSVMTDAMELLVLASFLLVRDNGKEEAQSQPKGL